MDKARKQSELAVSVPFSFPFYRVVLISTAVRYKIDYISA